MGIKEVLEKARSEGKRQIYGKETLTLGEFACWILALVIFFWGDKLKIAEVKHRFYVAMLIIFLGMLIW